MTGRLPAGGPTDSHDSGADHHDGDPSREGPQPQRLVAMVSALGLLSRATNGPRPAFRVALRRRLVDTAAKQLPARSIHAPPPVRRRSAAHRGPRPRAQHRRVVSGAMVLTCAVLAITVVSTTARSLPGDPFYPVKQTVQEMSAITVASERARGQRQLEVAATRIADIGRLLERDSAHAVPAIESALRESDALTHAGTVSLTRAYHRTGDIRPLNALDAFTRKQRTRLSVLLPRLPSDIRAKGRDSLWVVNSIHRRTVTMLAQSCRMDASCEPRVQAVPRVRP